MPFCSASEVIPEVGDLPGPVDTLRQKLTGDLFLFGEEGYENARLKGEPVDGCPKQTKTWNLDAAKYPCAIVRPVNAEDVAAAVSYARDYCLPNGIKFTVACGRHSHLCLLQDSFCVDMSRMRNVRLDKEEQVVYVEGGCLTADVDHVTVPHNLAVTLGGAGSTGVGGLMPQGGHGLLERTTGLSVDSMLEVTIVVASGDIVKASRLENSDLYWAVRGAGHNFGVITEFKMQLTPIPETLYGGHRVHLPFGFLMWPSRKELLLNWANALTAGNRDEANGLFVLVGGAPIAIEAYAWLGADKAEGKTHFQKALKMGAPLANKMSSNCTYAHLQTIAKDDAGKSYISGVMLHEITDELAGICESFIKKNPANCCAIFQCLGGKAMKGEDLPVVRFNGFWVIIQAGWDKDSDRERSVAWAHDFRNTLQKAANSSTTYGTLAGNMEKGDYFAKTAAGHYGSHYPRLQSIKRRYDPTNLFSSNINVEP